MVVLTKRLATQTKVKVSFTLALTAEARTKTRQRLEISEGKWICLRLPRGTVLKDGDLLSSEGGNVIVRIVAQPEPVMTVRGKTKLDLLRAAYHLGNRHVPIEITPEYLRLTPDTVLHSLLIKLGLQVTEETVPFHPETGAYGHSHS
ncbi:urease accessory protein UreE [Pleurocapsales cyanobacterium LEGE 06147]|nr:urease accessory protein UreE [Pleurocapsales cyanobacterium LEGE 06147]